MKRKGPQAAMLPPGVILQYQAGERGAERFLSESAPAEDPKAHRKERISL